MGSLSISSFKDQGFENIVLLNYFLFIGSSSNIVPMKDLKELINKFDINNISKSSAKFSKETLLSLRLSIYLRSIALITQASINWSDYFL